MGSELPRGVLTEIPGIPSRVFTPVPGTLAGEMEMESVRRLNDQRAAMLPVFQGVFADWWKLTYGESAGPVPRVTVEWGEPTGKERRCGHERGIGN